MVDAPLFQIFSIKAQSISWRQFVGAATSASSYDKISAPLRLPAGGSNASGLFFGRPDQIDFGRKFRWKPNSLAVELCGP